jgi:vacuolar protein sorting-associated protein 35
VPAVQAARGAGTAAAPASPLPPQLTRRSQEPEWKTKVEAILKFARKLISILATQVEAPSIALRLFLLAAQVADECGFEDLAYDLYVQAFSVYEDAISESRAQLQAITLITGTLQAARVFGPDNYDTLITKAALHGAKLLKKPHQATAVTLASHMWWQEAPAPDGAPGPPPAPVADSDPDADAAEGASAFPHRDSKRVLECLQKALRIANSCIEEIVTVQLYCDTLDKYLYYLDRGAPAVSHLLLQFVPSLAYPLPQVTPQFVNRLVDLITSSIDAVSSPDVHPSQRAPPGLLEAVQTPDMILRHFRNTLVYIRTKKAAADAGQGGDERWAQVDVVGALLKMGLER